MKKQKYFATRFAVFMGIIICLSSFAYAETTVKKDIGTNTISNIDLALIPYQQVIEKVNLEIGSEFAIIEENKKNVYNNIKDMDLHEFKKYLLHEYEKYKIMSKVKPVINGTIKSDIMYPNSYREERTQNYYLSYYNNNSWLFLDSQIFSADGTSTSYSTLYNWGARWSNSIGWRYHIRRMSHSLSSDRSQFTLNTTGCPMNEKGLTLLISQSYTVTFNANS